MESIAKLIVRDLNKLVEELKSFRKEENIWQIKGYVTNSAGNLTLHLVGNLNHFIGAVIGGTGYIRKRDLEFEDNNVPTVKMIEMVEDTKTMVKHSIENIDDRLLNTQFPIDVFGYKMTYEYFLIHLVGHLNYHLGQVNYIRRLID